MIISGASRSNGAFFSRHLMRADQNARVAVVEMRGLAYAEDVRSAFREMKERAEGTACKNYFYHANLNTRADEHLTAEQWAQAVDTLELGLGLDGQPRFIVEHEKDGRTHRHVIWSRIDADTMTAVSDSHNFRRHEEVASALEEAFGHEATARALTRDKDTTPRPEPGLKGWEDFRAAESKIDPKAMKAELTELWQRADSGPAFAAALEERGYILARGDRRDFCVIDRAGDEHSLGRRISGAKAAEIRSRMADVDASSLPSVEEARALARARQEEPQEGGTAAAQAEAPPADPVAPVETRKPAEAPAPAEAPPTAEAPAVEPFEVIRARRTEETQAAPSVPEERADPGRFGRFRAWCGGMREYVAGFGQQVQGYWREWFGQREQAREPEPTHETPTPATPSSTISAPTLDPQKTHDQPRGWEPEP